MSGYAPSLLANRGMLDPSVTLLSKPFTDAALLDKIQRALRQTDSSTRTPAPSKVPDMPSAF